MVGFAQRPSCLVALAAGVAVVSLGALPTANAFESLLARNLAYQSPSLQVEAHGLSHDVVHVSRRIKRDLVSQLRRRDSNATAADDLESSWNPDVGADGQAAYRGNVSFPYGVAAGDPYSDSAILWTHPVPSDNATTQPICLRYQVSRDANFTGQLADEGYAWTTAEVDYSYKVEAQNLSPKTPYFYRFAPCYDTTAYSPVGTFKTFPVEDDDSVESVGIAAFSCSSLPHGFFNSYAHAAKRNDVDFALHLGDWLYEYRGDGSAESYGDGRNTSRIPEPNEEIVDLKGYRTRHGQYRKDPSLLALTSSMAIVTVWDDHEVADNTWKGGSADSNDTAQGEVNGVRFTPRKRDAVRAYHEWMPTRRVDTTDDLRLWRSFRYGKLLDLSMLDTRQYERDITDVYYNTAEVAKMFNDTQRSLMGGKQEKWLYNELKKSNERGAIWKVVGQQIVLNHINYGQASFPVNYDSWDGYNANRRRLYQTVMDNKIDNMIYLSGDSHSVWLNEAVPQEWLNSSSLYDPSTGQGALGVEIAGTAVSSPPSVKSTNASDALQKASQLVRTNPQLQYAETVYRGYFSLRFTRDAMNGTFHGTPNVTTTSSDRALDLATFEVRAGENRLARPVNGGRAASSGALQGRVVDYSQASWNGTAFA